MNAADPPAALLGVDFTCAPTRRKPITVAHGRLHGGRLHLQALEDLASLAQFEALLQRPGPWCGAFDFPFGLPRVFVHELGLGSDTAAVVTELRRRCPDRRALRALVDRWCDTAQGRRRLPHRVTDTALPGLSSTSPLQTRYVPVGFMYFEGLWRLVRSGVTLPRLHAGDPARVALEGYPGLLAHRLLGRRSYKNSLAPDRRQARREMIDALEHGDGAARPALRLDAAARTLLEADDSGDRLDAVLCLVQAAQAAPLPHGGLAPDVDPVEGWIVGARPVAG